MAVLNQVLQELKRINLDFLKEHFQVRSILNNILRKNYYERFLDDYDIRESIVTKVYYLIEAEKMRISYDGLNIQSAEVKEVVDVQLIRYLEDYKDVHD